MNASLASAIFLRSCMESTTMSSRQILVRHFTLHQKSGDNANHFSARLQNAVGNNAHQAYVASAIDKVCPLEPSKPPNSLPPQKIDWYCGRNRRIRKTFIPRTASACLELDVVFVVADRFIRDEPCRGNCQNKQRQYQNYHFRRR